MSLLIKFQKLVPNITKRQPQMPGGVASSLTSTAMEISLVHFTLCQDSVEQCLKRHCMVNSTVNILEHAKLTDLTDKFIFFL